MKRVLIIGFLMVSAMTLFANGKGDAPADSGVFGGDDVTLKMVIGTTLSPDQLETLIVDFSNEYPNIQIEETVVPQGTGGWGEYFTKLKTMIASGNSPDVVRVAVEGFQLLHEYDLALPLNDYIEAHPEYVGDYDDLHPNLQAPCVIDGNIYGFGWDWNNVVVHINQDMLAKVGLPMPSADWDKEEFLAYAQALTYEEDGQKVYGLLVPNYYFALQGWMYNFGASYLTEDLSAAALDTPEALEAFQFLHDLVYMYEVSPRPVPEDSHMAVFTNRQVAMTFAGRWPVDAFTDAGLNFDIQSIPTFNTNQAVFGVGMFPVMSDSKHPEEAYILSTWLSSAENQKKYIASASIPARTSVMDDILPNSAPANSMLYRESADTARVVQAPAEYPEVQTVINNVFNSMMADPDADVKSLLMQANDEINQILQ